MRILQVADRLSTRGGADLYLRGLIEGLATSHDVELVVGRRDRDVADPCPTRVVRGLDANDRAPLDLAALLGRRQVDVVHLHNVMNPVALQWAADHRSVVTVHDHRVFCGASGKRTAAGAPCLDPMDRALCAACFQDAAYFERIFDLTAARLAAICKLTCVCLSRYMQAELRAAGVPSAQVAMIPPFVHGMNRRASPTRAPCVLFVGRLVESKGVLDAVEAWRRSGVSLPFVAAGTGPLRGHLEDAGVQVLGWVPHAAMSGLYRSASVMVMPSRWQEPFGLVGLEALHMGTPVAAWHSGGVVQWHGPADLVAWGDVDGLATRIRALDGRAAVAPDGFEPGPALAAVEALYEQVAGG